MAAAPGVLTSTSALGGMAWGLWSGVPLVAVILAAILSPDRRLPGTGSLSPQGSLLYLWWSLHRRPPGPPMSSGSPALAVVCAPLFLSR